MGLGDVEAALKDAVALDNPVVSGMACGAVLMLLGLRSGKKKRQK